MVKETSHSIGQEQEQDLEIAHKIALGLEKIVDEGVLEPSDLTDAPPKVFDEFILRFMVKGALEDGLSEKDIAKIRSLFGSERVEMSEKTYSREEVLGGVERLLAGLRSQGYRIAGLLVYGSSIEQNKTRRGGKYPSDLDLAVVLQAGEYIPSDAEFDWHDTEWSPGGVELYREEIERALRFVVKKDKITIFDDVPIEPACVYEMDNFREILASMQQPYSSFASRLARFPHWAWKPDAVVAVGFDKEAKNDIRPLLKTSLNSAVAQQTRKEALEKFKKSLP